MRKKGLISAIAYFLVFALMLSCTCMFSDTVSADEVTDDVSDEVDEEEGDDEDFDDEDWEIDTIVNFRATKITKNSVELKWDKVEDIDGYELTYKPASSSSWKTVMIESAKTVKYTVKKLKVGKKYNFRLRAFMYYGADDEEEDDEEDADVEEVVGEDDEDADDEEEDDGEEYEYGSYSKMSLKTLNKDGSGNKTAESDTSEKTAHPSVKAVKFTSVKAGAKKVTLKWKKNAKASGYELYMSSKKSSGFKKIKVINKNKTVKFDKKGLKSGKTYYFKIRAFVKSGKSKAYTKYSPVKSAKVK